MLQLAGVKLKELEVRLDDFNVYAVIDCYNWLRDLAAKQLHDFVAVYDRHPPQRWKMYEAMGIMAQLTEGRLLTDTAKEVRRLWRQRPQLLKEHKNGKGTQEEAEQADEQGAPSDS